MEKLIESTEIIEGKPNDLTSTMYQFLSRNEVTEHRKITAEEILGETLNELAIEYRKDLAAHEGPIDPKEDDASTLYPRFMTAAEEKAKEFNKSQARGPRRLCLVPSFVLALVMVSRVRRQWLHAPWFKIPNLCRMLENHGAVSNTYYVDREGTN